MIGNDSFIRMILQQINDSCCCCFFMKQNIPVRHIADLDVIRFFMEFYRLCFILFFFIHQSYFILVFIITNPFFIHGMINSNFFFRLFSTQKNILTLVILYLMNSTFEFLIYEQFVLKK